MNNWILRNLCDTCDAPLICGVSDEDITIGADYGIENAENVVTCEKYNGRDRH